MQGRLFTKAPRAAAAGLAIRGQADLDGVIAGGRFGESGAHRKGTGRGIYGDWRPQRLQRGVILLDRYQEERRRSASCPRRPE